MKTINVARYPEFPNKEKLKAFCSGFLNQALFQADFAGVDCIICVLIRLSSCAVLLIVIKQNKRPIGNYKKEKTHIVHSGLSHC